ncbi:Ger(x)C family spore germination protein [Jeotgalibacillus proteolyticus]|uniref:Ger(x)C family spore germination protein n=1 Tax=Jeotgalibacillus proteolyticus TaxID=2082395 RepID=UPI003CEDF4FF
MNIRIAWLIFCSLLLMGCASELKPSAVEDVALVSLIGIDYVDEENMSVTLAIPQFSSSTEQTNQIYTTQAGMIKEAIVDLSSQADKEIKLNGLRVVLFNEEFATSGKMWEVVEHLYRNPVIGGNVFVVIVKDTAEGLLSGDYPDKPSIVTYMNALLKPKPHIMFSPFTTIHNFMYAHSNPVVDIIVPYLEHKEGIVELSGIALFKHDKMEEVYSREEGQIVQMLSGAKKIPAATIPLSSNGEEREQVVIDFLKTKVDYSSNKDVHHPVLDITLKLKGSIYEYRGEKDLSKRSDYSKLEEEVRKFTEEQVEGVIDDLKEKGIDPIGLTENFRMHHHGEWTEEMNQQVLENLEYNLKVEMQILATGTLR